ncbi:MAG: DUF1549 domain-containing protein [Pirellulaceae bacterium]
MLWTTVPSWADSQVTSLAVYPPDVHLTGRQDVQRFLVVATRDDGVTLDVTSTASATLKDAALVLKEGNVLRPAADGATSLEVAYEGLTASATIEAKDVATDRPISFMTDVMPVFARAGCNTGSCHGAARGKDGFRLSLFGFDPRGDYYRLTREIGVRRVNLAIPDHSLIIEKATGSVPHTGGKLMDKDSPYYHTLIAWLAAGAPLDAGEPPAVVGVDLYPPQAVIEGEKSHQQFIARARYSDGSDRDVTTLVRFDSNNGNSATISKDGLVEAGARGEAFVTARYDTVNVGSQVIVLPKDLQYTAPAITGNYIDALVAAKLTRLRVLPSELCTDEEFLRRVTLDITGLLPTADEYQQFMADAAADKRAQLVDRLLQRKEFAEIWAMKWAELLMVKSSNEVSYKSMFLYSNWLTNKIAEGVPLDQMVRELLGATGGTFSNPATNFYQIERDTLKTAENVAEVFMGIRTQCTQCHNHPFDRWTMNDYYSFAAFFSQIGRKPGEDYRETIVFNQGSGEVAHPVTQQAMPPKFLGGPAPDTQGKDRRVVMAEWLTSADNPLFATSVANRVWAHFFGVGVVNPVDDIRVSNPPSNPALFEELGKRLRDYHFDFKQLVRDICNSQAYQRSSQRNESNVADERNFAHAGARRIRAEMLLDCICQVTETEEKFRGLPLGARAVQIADGQTSNYFLTTFGRARRDTVCAAEVSTDPSLSQALHMLNGSTITGKIAEGGAISRLLASGQTPEQVIESIFVRALTRRPTPDETQRLMEVVKQAENPELGLQDVFWAVLNSREFVFNH